MLPTAVDISEIDGYCYSNGNGSAVVMCGTAINTEKKP